MGPLQLARRVVSAAALAAFLAALAAGCLDGGAPLHDGDAAVSDATTDRIDASCQGPERTLGACAAPTVVEKASTSAKHIPDGTPIVYADSPPSSGDHRAAWARWGEYDYLPPERWVHNLEHGGVAFLYDPCDPAAVVDALRAFATARPADDSGPFRWVMTPYPGLPSAVAVVAWEWTWSAECVDAASLTAFVDAHYRKAPEDFGADGSYSEGLVDP